MNVQQVVEQAKHVGDAASITAVLSAWLGVLSTGATILATLLAAAWTLGRLIEMYTGKKIHELRKKKDG